MSEQRPERIMVVLVSIIVASAVVTLFNVIGMIVSPMTGPPAWWVYIFLWGAPFVVSLKLLWRELVQ